MNKNSKTDWARIDALTDGEIDTSDIPQLDEGFFKRARLIMPGESIAVTVHVDNDTLIWFKSLGTEYKRRMSAALRLMPNHISTLLSTASLAHSLDKLVRSCSGSVK